MSKYFYGKITPGYSYSNGDIIHDKITNDTKMFNNGKWISVTTDQSISTKKTRIIDKLKYETTEDILDTMLTLLIRANIVKDINEFKEMIEANKLAQELSNN